MAHHHPILKRHRNVYTITDEEGADDVATVSIEVRDLDAPVDPTDPSTLDNTPPIATDDQFETFNTQPFTSSIMSNDSDPDGDVITLTEINGAPVVNGDVIDIEDPNSPGTIIGTVTVDDVTTGQFTFTPTDPTFSGEPVFEYTIEDPSGATDTADVTIVVTADPDPTVNDPPEAGDDLATAQAGEPATTNLLDNDTDPNGTTPQIVGIIDPATGLPEAPGTPVTIDDPNNPGTPAGTIDVNPISGEATFTPEPGFAGTVQVPYEITDGTDTDQAVITIEIYDPPPVAEDDINVTELDTPVDGNLLINDSDPNPNGNPAVTEITTFDAAAC